MSDSDVVGEGPPRMPRLILGWTSPALQVLTGLLSSDDTLSSSEVSLLSSSDTQLRSTEPKLTLR